MKDTDEISILEARIRILTDKLTEQATTFDKMNNKMFALVGLLLTLGSLLTYDTFRIDFPDTVLEGILFVVALTLLGLTVALIGYNYRARKDWYTPIGPVEEVMLDNTKDFKDALNIMHKDYLEVYHGRTNILDHKAKVLNIALYMFVASVILLIVLKIGG